MNILNNWYNIVIVVLALIALAFEVFAFVLYGKASKIYDNGLQRKRESFHSQGKIIENETIEYNANLKRDIIEACKKPNTIHSVIEVIVPLMPLAGILGTVWGLSKGLQGIDLSTNGAAFPPELLQNMQFALSSTICGIISSIALKVGEAFLLIPKIESINTCTDLLTNRLDNVKKGVEEDESR